MADPSAKHSELVSHRVNRQRSTSRESQTFTQWQQQTSWDGKDAMRDRESIRSVPLWTFVVVVFLWRMDDGWDLAPEWSKSPDSHLGCVHLVEKPTNRLFVVDVIAVIGGQLFGHFSAYCRQPGWSYE
jgi:hypothetical protein